METATLMQHLSKCSNKCPETKILSGACDVEKITNPGYVNHLWRIRKRENPNESVIVKYASPYLKCLGLLTVDRLTIEYRALRKFNELHNGCTPKPYVFDEEHSLVIMEDLHDYKNMRKSLIDGDFDIRAIKTITEAIASIHRKTHRHTLTVTKFAELAENFQNDVMVDLLYEFMFTTPFMDHPTNKYSVEVEEHLPRIFNDEVLQENVARLRTKYKEVKDCLVHGNIHSDAVMVNNGSAKIFDPEFAHVGSPACDMGMILGNYVISYYSHKMYPSEKAPEFYNNLKEAFEVTLAVYLKSLNEHLSDAEIKSMLSDIAGFTGIEFFRWVVGVLVEDGLKGRPLAEVKCLDVGIRLVQRFIEISGEQQFIDCVFN